jgi:hypothetical protein
MSDSDNPIKGRQPSDDSAVKGSHRPPPREITIANDRQRELDESKQEDLGRERARLVPIPPPRPKK